MDVDGNDQSTTVAPAISASADAPTSTDSTTTLDPDQVGAMIAACEMGDLHTVQRLIEQDVLFASQQEEVTGRSPLMTAAAVGNGALCQYLLDCGAPWNAVDRQGYCAGNYATDHEHWGVVNLLVDWGVRAELILGTLERNAVRGGDSQEPLLPPNGGSRPVEHEPSTKPDYLQQRLMYTEDGQALIDSDRDAVMMEWERPLMKAHAQILMQDEDDNNNEKAPQDTSATTTAVRDTDDSSPSRNNSGKTVLNVGFGMGIIDSILQEYYHPSMHYIVEAHPDVYQRMKDEQWDQKPNVVILFGRWQDVLPPLLGTTSDQEETTADGEETSLSSWQVDAIFFDTY